MSTIKIKSEQEILKDYYLLTDSLFRIAEKAKRIRANRELKANLVNLQK